MRFFYLFTVLALGVSAIAAPLAEPQPIAAANNEIAVATRALKSLPDIISNLTAAVTPLVNELQYLTSENTTTTTLQPIISEIEDLIEVAIDDVQALTGEAQDIITGLISTLGLTDAVSELVFLIFRGITTVSSIVTSAGTVGVEGILAELSTYIATLLEGIVKLIDGVSILRTLLSPIEPILERLGTLGAFSLFQ
ncbi:hypothetical protein D9758_011557 [Tetrapyrgos nigripes]|uniref:Sc15 protein n=1 Tax=Tetrapyrgos nigripes TaxID=182062 RepID=A0A8H5CNB4_9AGAR|nr:hypothetical protein D9758_011557 [Tetrapyrgos nigripes]